MAEWTIAPRCKRGAFGLRRFESYSTHFCPYSSMDRVQASGACDTGSNPVKGEEQNLAELCGKKR